MAATADIVIDTNADFKMTVEYRNADGTGVVLTNYTFAMVIKDRPGGTTLATFTPYVTKDAVVAGRINVLVPNSITSTLTFDLGVYDLVAINSSPAGRTRLVKGRAIVDKGIS